MIRIINLCEQILLELLALMINGQMELIVTDRKRSSTHGSVVFRAEHTGDRTAIPPSFLSK